MDRVDRSPATVRQASRIACSLAKQLRERQRFFAAAAILARQCVQLRLACSVGVSPTGGKVRNLRSWVASVEETKRMKPTDKAIFGMASESPGRNASEPSGGLDKIESGGRALCFGAKAA